MDLTFSDDETRVPRRVPLLAGRQPAAARPGRRRRRRPQRLARRLAAPALRGRLGRAQLAERVRRPRRDPDPVGHLLRGDRARPRAPARQRARHPARRPDADGLGHRRAEGALPDPDPLGRGGLVPGLLRARRRLRPRLAQDPRGQGRRRLGRHRPEGVDQRAPSTRSGACSSPAPTPTPPSTRASPTSSWTWSRTRSRCARCARSPARPSSTSCSSRRRASRTRTSSAASATAGRSR